VLQTQPNTHFFRPHEVERKWYVVDVEGKTLGRVASTIAKVLRGKHKTTYTPNNDIGDFVVVINAEKVQLTGKRTELKQLYHNTMYPGGARFELVRDLLQTKPERVIEHAVKGMLPHTRLGRRIAKKLKVYRGNAHPHAAQKPETLVV
jgi:large subunit ribosomal protein L13